MAGFLAVLASGVAVLTLLAGCAAHLSRPAVLPAALRAHRVVPDRAVGAVALAVTGAEGLLGLGGTAALLRGEGSALPAVLAASAVLFGAYAGYARHVLATGRGGPCGCTRTELPLSDWVVVRAAVLAVLALTGALLTGALLTGPAAVSALPGGAAATAVAALAVPAVTALLWTLPAAMHDPAAAATAAATATPVPQPATGGSQWTS